MNLFIQKVSNIQLKNQTYRFLVIVMALVLTANSFYTFKMLKEQRIIIMPPGGVTEKVEISMNSTGEEYINLMARYIANLYLSYSPATARKQFAELIRLYHPSKYDEGRKFMSGLADKVEKSKIVSVYNIGSMEYDIKPGKGFTISTVGKRIIYVKGREVESKNMTLIITGWIKQGRFYLNEMKEEVHKK